MHTGTALGTLTATSMALWYDMFYFFAPLRFVCLTLQHGLQIII